MTLPPPASHTVPAAHCTRCGGPVFPGDRFCGGCGYSLIVCAACGAAVMPGAAACSACGATLAAPPATAAPAAPAESETDATWGPVVERLRLALINEFEIDGELGHGGMAAVFRARELALNRRVAIKVMAPGLLLGEGMVERFRQEAITVANLQHANIVAVHGVRTVGDLHMFVMQYIPGRSLDRVLRDHSRLSFAALRAIMYHVGSALDYAHRRGVIHRDIKPGNILLDGDGDPVVTDFGIAKVAETQGYTRVGTIIGTPTYMSPEQCMGYDVGPASDQYALGIVAYEMITGAPPFAGTGMAMMRAHTDTEPEPLRSRRPDVPPAIEAAIMRMLAKKPEDRFPDLAAAVEAIDAQPLGSLGATRAEMSALAAAGNAETHLAEIMKAPRSPVPPSVVPARPSPPPAANTVRSSGVAEIRVEPPAEPLEVGDCVVLAAMPRTDKGMRVENARLRWESSSAATASVDAAGVVTAHAPGSAIVTVTSGSARATVNIVVVDAAVAEIEVDAPTEVRSGTRATLSARALDRRGQAMTTPVTWSSRNAAVATVTTQGGLTPVRRGTAVLVAEAGGVARAVTIAITAPPVVDVVVDGVPPALVVGAAVKLRGVVRTARAADDDRERTVEWRSSDPAIATISADGTLSARAPGQATVTATCEGIRGSATISVVNVSAATVVIAPPPSPLRLGDTVALKATVYDASGKVVARPVRWRSTDPAVAPVDASGQLVARGEGWAIVTAQADGIDAHIEVLVRQPVVPVSASGKRESHRLALRWWVLLAALAGTLAVGWRFLVRR
ncbi:MAG TPA: protein kinase [Gemmatimonadaceae bacterium]|nr:protein kinase [Gemmatimonadaceae bacterium]